MGALQICAVVFSFISLLVLLISLGSNYWEHSSNSHSGLWIACYGSICGKLGYESDKLNAIRAFMLIGMIAGAVSFFGLCATCWKSRLGSMSLAMISAIVSTAAGLCVTIAMTIVTAQPHAYGWSFGLGWASLPLFLITSILAASVKSARSTTSV